METIIVAALQAVSLVAVALFGLYGARKLGIGQNQEKLVSTLKELIAAQDQKIEELQNDRKEDKDRIDKLERQVADLTDLTVSQAFEIQRLTKLSRRKVEPEGGE